MAKSVKPKQSDNHATLVVIALVSFVIVVMVLTRLYFVEKETITIKKQVSSLLEKSQTQNVSAPAQDDMYYYENDLMMR